MATTTVTVGAGAWTPRAHPSPTITAPRFLRQLVVAAVVTLAMTSAALSVDVPRTVDGTLWRSENGALIATFPSHVAGKVRVGDMAESGSWRGRVTRIENRGGSTLIELDPASDTRVPPDLSRATLPSGSQPLSVFFADKVRDIFKEN